MQKQLLHRNRFAGRFRRRYFTGERNDRQNYVSVRRLAGLSLVIFVLIKFILFSAICLQEGDGHNSFKRLYYVNVACSAIHNGSYRHPGLSNNSDIDWNPLVIICNIHTSSRLNNITKNILLQLGFSDANCFGW